MLNDSVKVARAAYFANLLSHSKSNPKMLFKIINTIVSPPSPPVSVFSKEDCGNFLTLSVEQVVEYEI